MAHISEDRQEIRAAGTVLWREGAAGGVEIALVHRPKYDDWSLPKGKLEPGETAPAAAVREVAEETGYSCVLGRFLTEVRYPVRARGERGEANKAVEYFSARILEGTFAPNAEVDDLRWLEPSRARAMLSYGLDVRVLEEFSAIAPDLRTLLLVRHGKAGERDTWNGDDDLRPLTGAGMRQAEALRAMLPLFGANRVHSAPRLRCMQTVRALAHDLGTEIVREPLLSEEGYLSEPMRGVERLVALADAGRTPVVCSQGAVIPDVVAILAKRDGVSVGGIVSKKASVWLLSFDGDADGAGPRLLAADYLASPFPPTDGGSA